MPSAPIAGAIVGSREPRIYDAFVDICNREDLWSPIDRANLNPRKKVEGNPSDFIQCDVAERGTRLRPSDPQTKSLSLSSRYFQDSADKSFAKIGVFFHRPVRWHPLR